MAKAPISVPFLRGASAREIAASVEAAIEQGRLGPGDALPSVRQLAAELDVSPMTVMSAFKELRARGVITTHERRRTRISPRPPIARRSAIPLGNRLRDLASDNPDPAVLPDLRSILARVEAPAHLYGDQTVLPELSRLACAQLAELGVAVDQVAVANGTFDAIERLLQTHAKPGDRVLVEDPGYTGVLDLVRALGLEPVGVEIDDFGMLPERLEQALGRGAVAAICTPRAQNPRGAAFDAERAADLRAVLSAHPHVLVVEDDHAGPITEEPYETLTGGRERWAIIRSVSKSLGPDLRLAVVAADRVTLSRAEGRQLLASGWVSFVLQQAVVELWKDRSVRTLLARAARTYGERRRALLAALEERGIEAHGRSGLNVWVPVEEETTAMRNMLALGWAVASGEIFRIRTAGFLRITTAAVPLEQIDELADDIARALFPERRTNRS